jgi:hypothetical protein
MPPQRKEKPHQHFWYEDFRGYDAMAEKRQEPAFTVTDRRSFTEDGELRKNAPKEAETPKIATETAATPPQAPVPVKENAPAVASSAAPPADANGIAEQDMPAPPTADEQQAQANAYRESSKELDSRVELSGRSAKEFEMTFERFLASLYMTAMLQLGLMQEPGGQPRIDIIGARQTIDTLALVGEKTKGNLNPTEETFLQNSLYEVRMAYVEVTNALSRPPQPPVATGTGGR